MPDITDNFSHGPYPDNWSRQMVEIWEHTTNTWKELYDRDPPEVYERLQEAFEKGWFDETANEPGRGYWRREFYDIAGIDPSGFDWEAWREYLGY